MGGEKSQYLRVGSRVSPTLTWERTNSVNGGIDIGFLKERLHITFDTYIRKTLDLLIPGKTLPSVFGAGSPKQTAGDLQTKGFDISVNWKAMRESDGQPLSYSTRAVLTVFKSHLPCF